MRIFVLTICFLFILGCSNLKKTFPTCENNGTVNFMYINIPCDNCINLIIEILESNSDIFNYDIIRNKDTHILINYCYDYNNTSSFIIEKKMIEKGFSMNETLNETQKKILENLCCTSQ